MKKNKESKENNGRLSELAVMCALSADNFRMFIAEIIGLDNAPFHNELDDTLSNQLNRKLAIALPRGFGKSTHLSVAYALWEIARNHNVRILLVSSTADVTRMFMREITGHIERNTKYRLWGQTIDPTKKGVTPKLKMRQKREERWGTDSIVIERDDYRLKDATIVATGLFGPLISKRADIIICDDIVNQENSATEEQRKKIKDWVYTTLMPILVPGGRFIYMGNVWHMDDLMNNLLKDPQFDVRRRTAAILHEATRQDLWEQWANIHLDESLPPEEKRSRSNAFYAEHKVEMEKGVEVLWPERFPYADLYLRRIANPYSFARMFQCDPSSRPNQKFSEADIEKALHKGRDLTLQDALRTEYETECTASGLDLAISLKDSSDDTVLLSIDRIKYDGGEFKRGDLVLRNIVRGKFAPKETIDIVLKHDAAVEPVGIRVESVAFQESLVLDLGDYNIPVRGYKTGAEKHDPDIGVNSLAIALAQGKFILPYNTKDARTLRLVTQLVNEMRAFPDGHSGDSLMALWFAYSEMREYTRTKFVVPSGTYTPPPEGPMNEHEADLEIIGKQEVPRSGWDPARALLERHREADRIARERIKNEERDVFNKMMRRY
ncbi:MAG: hypothetical protein ABSE76_02030 [Minisyncoccia bacterium]|jgi:hypothetical protein